MPQSNHNSQSDEALRLAFARGLESGNRGLFPPSIEKAGPGGEIDGCDEVKQTPDAVNSMIADFPPSTERSGRGGGGEMQYDDSAGLVEEIVSGQQKVFPPSAAKAGVGAEVGGDGLNCSQSITQAATEK